METPKITRKILKKCIFTWKRTIFVEKRKRELLNLVIDHLKSWKLRRNFLAWHQQCGMLLLLLCTFCRSTVLLYKQARSHDFW